MGFNTEVTGLCFVFAWVTSVLLFELLVICCNLETSSLQVTVFFHTHKDNLPTEGQAATAAEVRLQAQPHIPGHVTHPGSVSHS